ncbi:peroxisomal membrane protein pex14 [Ascochyta rabiei]|uniref:Peroxisomal membrane protein PEX14 n=1 Tax=Didymella rabiei TaxID=5454 RepID=A0A163BSU8_DIDRA|nr:peroxisomal membrane protein pex14 [Ascochyta rabiei]KZM21956.1 protein import into peroxisome matrix, docking [Ascochyta rabiei]UPX14584.1 peroxisomal membrane protein pex14 [Ascochyta rabiei]
MVREDLITSAVSFLQDPSVASAPLEKRIAFLQSKNLTQEEVDVSLARAASEDPSHPASPAPQHSSPPSNAYRPPPAAPGYGGSYPPQYWPQPPAPEPPKRDWRDYFIMATVMGGVGYGLYFTAKRYILPVISPPTAPQLEQDKASIDESFKRAFDLLEQLNTDTTALKASEEARTSRLDNALGEVESVLTSLKESSKRQGDDNRRIEDDVRGLRDLIPKALDAQKEANDNRLKELSTELKSLKTLVGNRMSAPAAAPRAASTSYYGMQNQQGQSPAPTNGTATPATSTPAPQAASSEQLTNGSTNNETQVSSAMPGGASTGAANGTTSTASTNTPAAEKPVQSWRGTQGRAAIPAWQMAAAKKNEEAKKDTSASGTVEASSSS